MTNYLTEPVVVGGPPTTLEELLVEAWLYCQPSKAADDLGWDTLQKLRAVPYGLYLAFEQGRNINPCVLAWREQPDLDLAAYDDVEYELHAVAYPGHRAEPAPEPVARFHEPIDAFIVEMARRIDEHAAKNPQHSGTLLVQGGQRTNPTQILINAAIYEVAGFIFGRIEEQMLLRPAVYDDETGQLQGFAADLAPGLAAAWKRYLAER